MHDGPSQSTGIEPGGGFLRYVGTFFAPGSYRRSSRSAFVTAAGVTPASGRNAVDASIGRDCRQGSRKNSGAIGVTGRNRGAAVC